MQLDKCGAWAPGIRIMHGWKFSRREFCQGYAIQASCLTSDSIASAPATEIKISIGA